MLGTVLSFNLRGSCLLDKNLKHSREEIYLYVDCMYQYKQVIHKNIATVETYEDALALLAPSKIHNLLESRLSFNELIICKDVLLMNPVYDFIGSTFDYRNQEEHLNFINVETGAVSDCHTLESFIEDCNKVCYCETRPIKLDPKDGVKKCSHCYMLNNIDVLSHRDMIEYVMNCGYVIEEV